MLEPPLAPDEPHRLRALAQTQLMDSPMEERFERITRLVQKLFNVPIAAISLVGADRQWFKSAQGMSMAETSRAISFCGHTVLGEKPMVVNDARVDPRFEDNPLVTGDPHVVFYAGCPLRAANGSNIGALCVVDRIARELSPEQLEVLQDLAVVAETEIRSPQILGPQQALLRVNDSLLRRANVDSLTRVWNREGIEKVLLSTIAHAQTTGKPAAAILLNLSQFRKVNEQFGHVAGDELLQGVAKKIVGAIRELDAAGRVEADKFLIVPGECEVMEFAREIGQHILGRVTELPCSTNWGNLSVNASVGIAFSERPGAFKPVQFIKSARAAMDRAKTGGTNRIEIQVVENE